MLYSELPYKYVALACIQASPGFYRLQYESAIKLEDWEHKYVLPHRIYYKPYKLCRVSSPTSTLVMLSEVTSPGLRLGSDLSLRRK